MTDKMRDDFEVWAQKHLGESHHVSIYRDEEDYSLLPLRRMWAAWQASHAALLKKQVKEQEEFLDHLADFEQEDTFHD